ncbi:plastocyanin/azurin family copper-binding protein [Paenibacillus harenae]|uniref:Lipoprotein with Yx(FWY)xxD motif/plastocyanin n=1 Tax=Paenibacillus harenae TaxID=306543 RepID=A0ABT9U2C9_PAEHA|nr:plastocyanin/azurin family copper-binding protein [Paenibacillus harenae]MDQ0113775.1 putative lipoprotein with Yx(FWY)xxD motif/plastocyanin [Paenibacillus harenae]
MLTRFKKLFLITAMCTTVIVAPLGTASAEDSPSTIKSDADTAAELGLLIGEGNGVNAAYLGKSSTRLQAAIISLRLNGKLNEALAFTGNNNFSDADQVGKANQPVLAYLKSNPELGWQGAGNNRFDPSAAISSQQFYKVILENLGYKTGADFTYQQSETFAASHGLKEIAGMSSLQNTHLATALVEALSAHTKNGKPFFDTLQASGVIASGSALPQGERIGIGQDDKLGKYFTDKNGRALYFFTKDAEDVNSCQGDCLKNWPIYYDANLQIPAWLNKADFAVITRTDGTKQLTYKNWPLYYFVKDSKPGDVTGEGVGGVWFAAKSDYAIMLGTSKEAGNYLTDDYGRALYYFDKDTSGKSVCEGNCLVNWPAYSTSSVSVPSTIKGSDIGTITRSDGSKQASIKGFPLYYFINDKAHGDLNGQGVNDVWYIVDPAKFNGTTASITPAEPTIKTYNIDIKEYSFGTEALTIEAGSKVIFTNYDEMKHNAVALDGSFSTPLLAKGESYTVTFDKPGTYNYLCEPHMSFMTGQIIVK